jgi:hypothetical protein
MEVYFFKILSVEFYEGMPEDNIQGCLEIWMEGLKKGYYRINLFLAIKVHLFTQRMDYVKHIMLRRWYYILIVCSIYFK